MNLTTKYSFMKKLETSGHEVPLPLAYYLIIKKRKRESSLYLGYDVYKRISSPWLLK